MGRPGGLFYDVGPLDAATVESLRVDFLTGAKKLTAPNGIVPVRC